MGLRCDVAQSSPVWLSPVPRSIPRTVAPQAEGLARSCSWARDLSGRRRIPTARSTLGHSKSPHGESLLPGEGQRGWRGTESGHQIFCTWHRHTLPAGQARAKLACIPGSGFCQWRDRCLRKLENTLRKQTDKTSAFLSPCPNRSLISFPSCKIPSLAFPTAKPPHAGTQNLPRDRERALCSRPWAPWDSFVSRHQPRTQTPCCFYTPGFAMGFFPPDNRWPHSFYFQKLKK